MIPERIPNGTARDARRLSGVPRPDAVIGRSAARRYGQHNAGYRTLTEPERVIGPRGARYRTYPPPPVAPAPGCGLPHTGSARLQSQKLDKIGNLDSTSAQGRVEGRVAKSRLQSSQTQSDSTYSTYSTLKRVASHRTEMPISPSARDSVPFTLSLKGRVGRVEVTESRLEDSLAQESSTLP